MTRIFTHLHLLARHGIYHLKYLNILNIFKFDDLKIYTEECRITEYRRKKNGVPGSKLV